MHAALIGWYRRVRRDLPWRRTRDPYAIWVSEVMLQQTTVRVVVPYYRSFLRRFPTVRALARAPLPAVLAAWSGLGYYRRARHLHAAARVLVRAHRGRFPRRLDEALALPGVGRYTAGSVLSIAFGERLPILDGNVARVLARLHRVGGAPGAPGRERRLWALAAALVRDSAAPGDLNQALMELGATVCTPVAPACGACPVSAACAARAAGVERRIPPPRRRPPAERRRATVALIERRGRYLMRRRRARLMEGLWELPDAAATAVDGPPLDPGPLVATLRHTIMRRLYDVEVREARLIAEPAGPDYRWIRPRDLNTLPTSSLVTKIFALVEAGGSPLAGARRQPRGWRRDP